MPNTSQISQWVVMVNSLVFCFDVLVILGCLKNTKIQNISVFRNNYNMIKHHQNGDLDIGFQSESDLTKLSTLWDIKYNKIKIPQPYSDLLFAIHNLIRYSCDSNNNIFPIWSSKLGSTYELCDSILLLEISTVVITHTPTTRSIEYNKPILRIDYNLPSDLYEIGLWWTKQIQHLKMTNDPGLKYFASPIMVKSEAVTFW